MKPIQVVDRFIGPGHPCFIVAEIGINHNGDVSLAEKSIIAAAEAGADAVKFQNYRTEDFLSDRTLTYSYRSGGKTIKESQYDMFKRCELTTVELRKLKKTCDRVGTIFFSTPTGREGLEDLIAVKARLVKNGSDFLTNIPLIEAMARSAIPTILSTGMATIAEIDDAVRAFRRAKGKDLMLLHCTSSYPTPSDDVNLRRIPMLASTFGCPSGLSDHTEGIVAAIGAACIGACMIEKHFTLDRNLSGPDHWFSSTPDEFRTLVDAVRTVEKQLGNPIIGPTPSEETGRKGYRLSCVAADHLNVGHRLVESDIVFRRPGTGLPPVMISTLIGRRLTRKVPRGKAFDQSDFES